MIWDKQTNIKKSNQLIQEQPSQSHIRNRNNVNYLQSKPRGLYNNGSNVPPKFQPQRHGGFKKKKKSHQKITN